MKKSDLSDPKIRAWILNCCINGLRTNLYDPEEISDFAKILIERITTDENGIFARGDQDGILCEDELGEPFGLIMFQSGIIKFRMLVDEDNLTDEISLLMGRTVMATIGILVAYIGDDAPNIVKPASGLIPGGFEHGVEYEDDGFSIT